MKHGFYLFLLAILAASLGLPQTATTPKKGTTTAKKATASAKKGKSTKKSGKTAPVSRYRQTTPTPERYREIQQALADKGYLKSEPNGVWDAQSTDALSRFQADRKLTPTGKITSASLIGLGLGPKSAADPAKPAEVLPKSPDPAPGATPEN
jgi:hypothetical protein